MIIVVMVVLNQTKGKSFTNSGHYYIPNEKRLIPYSNYFCQSLKVKTTKYSSIHVRDYVISLNLLDSDPYLFDHNIIYIKSMEHLNKNRVYYIHFGSNIIIDACNHEDSDCSVININKMFNNGSTSVVGNFSLYSCGEDLSPYSYSFEDEGYYFFNTDTLDIISCDMFINITLYLTSYSLYGSTSISSCGIRVYNSEYFFTSCSIDLPLSTTSYALLSIKPQPTTKITKFDEVPLETICEPRVWVYLLIIPLAGFYFHLCCAITFLPLYTLRFCVYILPYLCTMALISILVGICFHGLNHYRLSYEYNFIPGNTHVVPFSNVYCKSLNIKLRYNGTKNYLVSLYQLSAKPHTYDQQPLSISEEIQTEIRRYYLLYLNNGSTISIKACFANDSVITPNTNVYIAKGIDGYNGGLRQSDIKVLPEFEIYYNCTSSYSSYHQFSVTEDNFYYIIFFTSTIGYIPKLYLRVEMDLYLTQYRLEKSTITSNCSLLTYSDDPTCSVGVSLLHTDYVLLSTYSNSFDKHSIESIPIEIQCSPRLWIFIFPSAFLLLLVGLITCCCISNRKIALCCNWFSLYYAYIKMATPDQTDVITAKFKRAWTKGRVGEVTAVFVVHNRWHQFVRWFRSGREEYYHGTKLCCNIKSTRELCRNESCGICAIARRGFDKNKIRRNSFQRFGPGFYLAPNSSKANDYAKGSYSHKAMLLCDVYPGKKYKLSQNNTNINGPPRRFRTIYGTVGGVLNYGEIVVQSSKSDDIHPRYIIVYK